MSLVVGGVTRVRVRSDGDELHLRPGESEVVTSLGMILIEVRSGSVPQLVSGITRPASNTAPNRDRFCILSSWLSSRATDELVSSYVTFDKANYKTKRAWRRTSGHAETGSLLRVVQMIGQLNFQKQ